MPINQARNRHFASCARRSSLFRVASETKDIQVNEINLVKFDWNKRNHDLKSLEGLGSACQKPEQVSREVLNEISNMSNKVPRCIKIKIVLNLI